MAAGSDSTDVIMINGGVDVAIEDTIIHNHRMIIFISLLHFCNDVLSGGQRQLCCFVLCCAAVIDIQVVGRWLCCCCCSGYGVGPAVEVRPQIYGWLVVPRGRRFRLVGCAERVRSCLK